MNVANFIHRFSIGTNSIAKRLLVLILFIGSAGMPAVAQEDLGFKIGDIVEIEFLGKKTQGTVVGFIGTGWPQVEFEHGGRTRKQPFPPNRIKLVSADEPEPAAEAKEEPRTWKDASGKFEIVATLLNEQNGKVQLEKEDGRVVSVPIEKLSEADQKYLTEWKARQAAKTEPEDENPFAGGTPRDTRPMPNEEDSFSESDLETIEPDIAAAKTIVLGGGAWPVEADAELEVEFLTKAIGLNQSGLLNPIHDRLGGLAVSADGKSAAISIINPFAKISEVQIVDIGASKTSFKFDLPYKDGIVAGLSPSGEYVASMKKPSGNTPGRLDFWKLADDAAKHESGWKTAGFFDKTGLSLEQLVFLDEQRILTMGSSVTLLDWKLATAVYAFSIDKSVAPGFSANRKQLAVYADGSVLLVSVDDGKTLAALPAEKSGLSVLAISKQGDFLAGFGAGNLRIWDLSDGNLIREMTLSSNVAGNSLTWLGDKYLLVGDQHLVDVELRTIVWQYTKDPRSSPLVSNAGGQFWYAIKGHDDGGRLVSVKLPQAGLDDLTTKMDPDELLVFKPGARVALKIDLPFPPDEQKAIHDRFVEQLEASGVTVDDKAEIVLKAFTERGKEDTISLRNIRSPRFGGEGEKVSFTPTIASITLTKGEQKLWAKTITHGPVGMIIRLQSDETSQQAVDRLCQPNPGFFHSTVLPKYLALLPEGKANLGTSVLSNTGLK